MTQKIIYGIHAVTARLKQEPESLLQLNLIKGRLNTRLKEVLRLAEHQKVRVARVDKAYLSELSGSGQHQGILAICLQAENMNIANLKDILDDITPKTLLLVLDGVQDPHNLGACLRSANGAGVTAVIGPKDKAAGITAVVSKVASGAAEETPYIQVTNLARTLEQLKEAGVWCYGLDGDAEKSLYQGVDLTGPIALVLGGEGQGLRRLTKECCDMLLKLPMLGGVESLNVSVAAGVSLYEVLRQRLAHRH